MTFMDVEYEDVDKFIRTDLAPYRAIFEELKPGRQATIVVDTGTLNEKGKGDLVIAHERAFRQVAKEKNVGLRVGHTNMPGGKTRLRLMVDKKREFSPEALKKRTEALEAGREKKAVDGLMAANPELTREAATKQYREERARKQAEAKKAAEAAKKAS